MASNDARDFLKTEKSCGLDRDHAVDDLALGGDDRRSRYTEHRDGLDDFRHMLRFDLAQLALGRLQRRARALLQLQIRKKIVPAGGTNRSVEVDPCRTCASVATRPCG